jgi:probable HAF family extracellular repeat protein
MNCKLLVGIFVVATVFATKVAAQTPPPPPTFNLTDLGLVQNIGPPGGVTAVNASGHAIGTLLDPSGFYQNAFVWQNGVITNLGTLPNGNISYGYAINNSGQAVGVAQLAAAKPYNTLRAVIWQNGVISNLSDPNPDGGVYSAAYGINSAGEIVGYENSALGYTRPVIWKPAAIAASPGGAVRSSNLVTITTALAHNFVAGDSVTIGGVADPAFNGTFVIVSVPSSTTFTYSQSGGDASSGSGTAWDKSVMAMLACDFAVCSGMALAINDNGQAVGWSYGPGTGSMVHPVVWDSNGTPTDIGTLGTNGESYNLGTAINNSGSAVGYVQLPLSQIGFTEIHAFLYQNGSRQDLGAIPGLNSGGTTDSNSTAWGINSNGDVVGISSPAASAVVGGTGGRAFLYTAGTMYDLTSLIAPGSACGTGWQLENAYGINDNRQIVGVGIAPDRREHGYLLTPTTAAAPMAITAASVASSMNPSVYGQQVNFTVTLSSCAASSVTPTGNVTIYDGSTPFGTLTSSSGPVLFGTSNLSVGSQNITASYTGDNNFGATTSPALTQVVNPAATMTTLASSSNPSSFGQTVTLTASVAAVAPGAGIPTGTVTFLDGTTTLGTATLNSASNATLSTSSLAIGSNNLTASYIGDANFAGSTAFLAATVTVPPHFAVSTPASASVGAVFNFTVTARDQFNNPVSGYTGTVHFTSTDPQASLPPDYTFTGYDSGTHTFSATLNTPGAQVITAADTASAAITGTSNPITVSSTPPPLPSTFTLTDLGPMNITAAPSGATALNSSGQVTGFRFHSDIGANRAFLWNNGTISDLTTLGGLASFGYGINNAGQIVGSADLSSTFNTERAFVWQNGVMTNLGDPVVEVGYSFAFGINSNGDAAGYDVQSDNYFRPIIWKGATNPGRTVLTTLPCQFFVCQGEVLAINDSGQAAGWSNGAQVRGYRHAVRWDSNGQPTDLGSFGRFFNDQANAINSNGVVVGYSQLDPDVYYSIARAFVWQNGTLQDLGTIPGIDPIFGSSANITDNNSSAWGINTRGDIVGISAANLNAVAIAGNGGRAFLYTNGNMYDLSKLLVPAACTAWKLEAAWAINDNGQIVGVGFNPAQQEHGFLLTPATGPTPTSLTASANSAVFGQPVNFTATVGSCPTGSMMPTGTVTFSDGSTVLGSIPVSSGTAVFSTSGLSVGSHSITASYGGDASFGATTSAPLTETVSQAPTTTSLGASPNPANLGQLVTLTAMVAPVAPGAGTPTGTVTFLDGTTTLGTGVLDGTATATLTTSTLALGIHILTASYGGDANFLTSTSTPVDESVAGSPVNLSIGAPGVTYGTAASATISASGAGGTVTGNVTLSVDGGAPASASLSNGSATFNLGFLGAGSHSLSANYPAQGSFLSSTASGTVTVNPAPLIITASSGSLVYGGPALFVTPSYNAFVNGDAAASLTTAPTCTTTATSTSAVGTYASSCFGAVDPNYAFTYVAGTVTVTPATTTTTESVVPSSVTYGTAASVTVAVTSPAGTVPGNVALSVDGGAASTMSLSNGSAAFSLGILMAGNHTLTASFAAQGNFLGSSAQATLAVNQAPATVTANAASKTYGSADPTLTETETGFINADAATIALSATRASGESAGTYAITPSASGAALANYKVTYVTAPFTINKATATVTATAASKTYGTAEPTLSATETGFTAADAASITLNATRAAGESAGTYTITPFATGAALANYSVTYTTATFTINKASAAVTATAASKTYGAADPGLTATESGFTTADAATITLSATRAAGENVGTYAITPSASGAALANYSVTYATATFTISKATAPVTLSNLTQTYAGVALTPTAATVPSGLAIAWTGAPDTNTGSYAVTATVSNPNYTGSNSGTFVINPAKLTITANNATKVFGTANPTLTWSAAGFVNSENSSVFTSNPTCTTTATTTSPIGSYPITCSGGAAKNYSFAYVTGTLTITGNSTGALSMGFWKNPNGQNIITNYCKPSGGMSLMTFLTGFNPFKDDTATTCASEAAYVSGIINAASCSGSTCNAMLRAQMLATALDVYFSTPGLGGNQVGAYNGLGASTPALGGTAIDLSSVCSMADGSGGGSCSGTFEDARSEFGITTSYRGTTVLQLLSYANYSSKTNGSPVASPNTGQCWYADNKARQVIAKDVFDNINNDIAKIAPPGATTNPSF